MSISPALICRINEKSTETITGFFGNLIFSSTEIVIMWNWLVREKEGRKEGTEEGRVSYKGRLSSGSQPPRWTLTAHYKILKIFLKHQLVKSQLWDLL